MWVLYCQPNYNTHNGKVTFVNRRQRENVSYVNHKCEEFSGNFITHFLDNNVCWHGFFFFVLFYFVIYWLIVTLG